uniref:BRK domain-containing protein n=1 Tax=Acrobeloides nanus TaxID=290746 RepID=A0A914DGM8_9BILA
SATDSDALNLSKKDTPKSSVVTSAKSASTGGSGAGGSGSSGGGSAQANASAVQNPLTSLSFPELLALSALPKETNIHVVHSETGVRLTGDKAPKLKHLEQWLIAHSKYKVDLNSMFGLSTTSTNASSTSAKTTPTATPAKSAVVTKASTTATSMLSTPIASTSEVSPGGGLEPGEIPKPKATTATPATDPTIGVFHRQHMGL